MKVAILGASMSHQSRRHDTGAVVGYSVVLEEEFSKRLGLAPGGLTRRTYPGNRLNDGGLIQLREVLRDRPDVCVIEPLVEDSSRGTWAKPYELRSVYHILMRAGIVPVTFMVPLPAGTDPRRVPVTRTVREICAEYDLPVHDVDIPALVARGLTFAGHHTTADSAPAIGRELGRFLEKLDIPALKARLAQLDLPEPGIRMDRVPVPAFPSLFRLKLDIAPKGDAPFDLRVIQEQQVGPFSPMLSVTLRDAGGTVLAETPVSVWDPYCHFERASCVTLFSSPAPLEGPVMLDIARSEEDPAYDTCRREVDSWPGPAERLMKPAGAVHLVSSSGVAGRCLAYEIGWRPDRR